MSPGTTRTRPEYRNLLASQHHSSGGTPFTRNVRITNPQGLHMRPAAAFAQLARQFSGAVTVHYQDRNANGKRWVDLMLLAAAPGDEVVVEVSGGPDADSILEALAEMLASDGLDGDSPAPNPKG